MQSKYISIYRYIKDVSVDRAKKRRFPKLRGTWLPSFDQQQGRYVATSPTTGYTRWCGMAINWLGLRVRISTE